jgi:ferritin
MHFSPTLVAAFNDQIRLEYESMYAYAQMSAYCTGRNLAGFGHWMRQQAAEELTHALKFTDFVLDRGGTVTLQPIKAPVAEFVSAFAVFEASLAHERHVSASIEALYATATQEQDFPSYPMLQWFMSEQIEEESTVGLIVERLRLAGDNSVALLMLDRELGQRAAPSTAAPTR